jgi:hypothetical protein
MGYPRIPNPRANYFNPNPNEKGLECRWTSPEFDPVKQGFAVPFKVLVAAPETGWIQLGWPRRLGGPIATKFFPFPYFSFSLEASSNSESLELRNENPGGGGTTHPLLIWVDFGFKPSWPAPTVFSCWHACLTFRGTWLSCRSKAGSLAATNFVQYDGGSLTVSLAITNNKMYERYNRSGNVLTQFVRKIGGAGAAFAC